jgi:ABC-type multidrug transport system ATPase subunit
VILDEPFNWLDPVAALDLRAALEDLVSDDMLLITALHDMTTLCGFCDTGALMSEGTIRLPLTQDQLQAGRNDPLKFERWMIDQLR